MADQSTAQEGRPYITVPAPDIKEIYFRRTARPPAYNGDMMSKVPTKTQVSAGGIVFRRVAGDVEVAIIGVDAKGEQRWQLPKGIVGEGESAEETALREVREETGLEAEIVGPLETIEYWYYGSGGSIRFHKYVHFFLMSYRSGSTADHDHEVTEARWVPLAEAEALLTFKSERARVQEARELIAAL